MRFVPTATAFVPIACLVAAGAAVACSCVPYRSAAEHVAATPLVFKGWVVGITRGEYEAVTRFQVLDPFSPAASASSARAAIRRAASSRSSLAASKHRAS